MTKTKVITALDATIVTGTSNKFYVGGAKRIGFLFRLTAHSSGNTVWTVNIGGEAEDTVTPTMTAANMLIGNTAEADTSSIARVASVTSTADGDKYAWLDPFCLVTWISITATRTTDGTQTAYILLEYED